ncbi:mitochondrial protein C2orf69 homolog isoform X1 [Patella vulgata]|uniref:mitochondrial protein C2orf69 homolog isoform X1 n=1 Tax=Patella vulgata TaxID=6465 RepID=UPI00218016CA|nr:mitochondrial protein C2orf69 homolog isoform X1 [Patella vulgata]
MSTASTKTFSTCLRLLSVVGHLGKKNDVILCGDPKKADQHVIYFGGDVQDYKENMESHRDNKRYLMWNLEDTASLISKKFPSSAIFVIRPSRMHLKTFSVYQNFVTSNDFGCPTHSSDEEALEHLCELYKNAVSASISNNSCELNAGESKPLVLMGFSKGCIVLNQILYELEKINNGDIQDLKEFVKSVKDFYWLDGGHSGGKNTWVTDSSALQALAQLDTKIHVHVTPYQIKDEMRSWIGKEEKQFIKTLKKYGANVTRNFHFESEERCIENHFKVLEAFE